MAEFGDCFNMYCQLGLGTEYEDIEKVDTGTISTYLNDIKVIECGYDFGLCINGAGKAIMFGRNGCGECGHDRSVEKISIPSCMQALKGLEDIVFVSGSCGYSHTILLTKDNDLYGFGANNYHQTGNIIQQKYRYQCAPYKITKKMIGIGNNSIIVGLICRNHTTIVVCE